MDRVETAKQNYNAAIFQLLQKKQLSFPPKELYLRVFKEERQAEVWARDKGLFTLIRSYPFTAYSGQLGPKHREGDLQIPEGFYIIDRFNPQSNYYLSMRVNYPNEADLIRNIKEKNIGGDIYIHGSNKSIGCVPLGDNNIQELYWLCWKFHLVNSSAIRVHIFPFRMSKENMALHKSSYADFWQQLEPMYRFFESHHLLGDVTVDGHGNYKISLPWD